MDASRMHWHIISRPECRTCAVRSMALFADLTEDDLGHIHSPIMEGEMNVGDALYFRGDEARHVFTIKAGLVKLVRFLPDGTQRIVRLLRPGAAAGLEGLESDTYTHDAIAVRPIRFCRIPVEVIRRLEAETGHLHDQIIRQWKDAAQSADRWLVELTTGERHHRVARLLLELTDAETSECVLPTREDMGAILNMSLETASRVVAEFRREGILEGKGNALRVDTAALATYAA